MNELLKSKELSQSFNKLVTHSHSRQINFAGGPENFETTRQLIKISLGINRKETRTYWQSKFIFNVQNSKYFIEYHNVTCSQRVETRNKPVL